MLAIYTLLLAFFTATSAMPQRRAIQCAIPATVGPPPQPMARSDQTAASTSWAIRIDMDSDFSAQIEEGGPFESSFVRLRLTVPSLMKTCVADCGSSRSLIRATPIWAFMVVLPYATRTQVHCLVQLSDGNSFRSVLRLETTILIATGTARCPKRCGIEMIPDLGGKPSSLTKGTARRQKMVGRKESVTNYDADEYGFQRSRANVANSSRD
jgi:hypothetical protein